MSVRRAIGANLYLTHGDEGMSDYLMISAHGLSAGRPFVVPDWTRLHYYAPRGQFLIMDMNRFNLSAVVEEQIDGGNHSPNYLLSKYQGRHGAAGENYDSLGAMVDRVRTAVSLDRVPQGLPPDAFKDMLPFDVLTIRNRSVFKGGAVMGIPFSDVLAAVGSVHHYSYIFCSFCRGSVSQAISDKAFELTGGRLGTNRTHTVRTQ